MLHIALQFNSQVQEKRHSSDSQIPFEYCYDLRFSISGGFILFCSSFIFDSAALTSTSYVQCKSNQLYDSWYKSDNERWWHVFSQWSDCNRWYSGEIALLRLIFFALLFLWDRTLIAPSPLSQRKRDRTFIFHYRLIWLNLKLWFPGWICLLSGSSQEWRCKHHRTWVSLYSVNFAYLMRKIFFLFKSRLCWRSHIFPFCCQFLNFDFVPSF